MFDVSIIIPVYKAKYTIKKTLESINNQKFKNKIPKIELILSIDDNKNYEKYRSCLLYTSPSPRDISGSRMPSSA